MEALLKIIAKPDNIPVLLLLPGLVALLAWWWFVARRSDRAFEEGGEEAVRQLMDGERSVGGDDRLHSWPYLVRVELVALLVVLLVLIAWSILLDAPLEQQADPTRTPNPSKAPWYFLGLQEMLVYFDPWIAGVVLPLLIIVGLCLIPYLDVNPAGDGRYGWQKRRFAISVFLAGFAGMWVPLIIIGVACRGPGWNWYWPWESWTEERVVDMATINWPELFGISSKSGALIFGAATIAGYYGLALVFWWWRQRKSPTLQRMGRVRYGITAVLLLTMIGLPIKMILRLAFSVKYVWTTPWFNI